MTDIWAERKRIELAFEAEDHRHYAEKRRLDTELAELRGRCPHAEKVPVSHGQEAWCRDCGMCVPR